MVRRLFSPLIVLILAWPLAADEIRLKGKITDENNAPVAGVKVSIGAQRATSDPTGVFVLTFPKPGDYLLNAEREGFFKVLNRPIKVEQDRQELQLRLNHEREVFESVKVAASPGQIDMDQPASPQALTGAEVTDVPYPNGRDLQNAMRLAPGVTRDSTGGVHVQGGAPNQTLYTLDGFNANDPLNGDFESRVNVEAVRTMEVTAARIPAEYGKGSAGVLAIQTQTGDDSLRYSATNFIPGIQGHKGLQFGSWAPRFGLSGPLMKGRAWFSDSLDLEYSRHIIEELPKGQDQTTNWQFSNLLRNQINLTPSNILFTGLLIDFFNAPRNGLSAATPAPATVDRRTRQYFFDIKDQVYFHRGALLEYGYAAHRTLGREIPQGHGIYVMTPTYDQGNYFADTRRRGGRDQWLANLFLPSFKWAGNHQIKAGIDLDRVEYWQDVRRTGYEQLRFDGSLLRQVFFGGQGSFDKSNFEVSSYVQDSWRVRPGLLFEIGLRQDWDSIIHRTNFGPRSGFAWAPPGMKHTKISGGFGIVYDATNLRTITQPMDQYSLVTSFNPDGTVQSGPSPAVFAIYNTRLRSPRYANWSAGVERQLPHGVFARVDYLGRRGRDGLTYFNTQGIFPAPPVWTQLFQTSTFAAIYDLSNRRRDIYDSVGVTFRKPFGGRYEVMGSYTRSRAFSNAVVDNNVDSPLNVVQNTGRLPWDAPNRILSWAYLPAPFKNWAVAYLWEWHTGFPYSVQTDDGTVVGRVNQYRLPKYFELNVHLERRFVFRKQRWALRGGVNNITGSPNPTQVFNTLGSPVFGKFYGRQGRVFNCRIRWLGKE